jgi:hypothetical protein
MRAANTRKTCGKAFRQFKVTASLATVSNSASISFNPIILFDFTLRTLYLSSL